jgi:hypothetical protein
MKDMEVRLRLDGDDAGLADLKSLEDWLLDEPELASCTVSRPAAGPEPGQMGAISDVLVVALGSGGMGAALAGSLSVWLRSRVSQMTIRIRTDQGEVEMSATSTRDPGSLIREIIPAVPRSGPGPA